MLSTTAEYALRIVTHLAEVDEDQQTSEQIAQATKVPADYALKILHALGRAGLVRGQRGRGGGFSLDCDPAQTTLYDVVSVIDPIRRITSCPLELKGHRKQLCALHRRLDEIIALLESSLREFTIADLLAERRNPGLCSPDRKR